MLKKYLVYISSSQEDLKAERRELARIITELGAIPVTMDSFEISKKSDRRIINKAIEECDYFLNLTAYRGGEAMGNSFALESEYNHAVKAGIPVLALIIDEKARWKEAKKEKSENSAKALEVFKKKLQEHAFDTWTNLGDLRQKALSLISREMNLKPRQGWVPSTSAVDPSVANELCRLIQENNTLKSQIKMAGINISRKSREQVKHILRMMSLNRISLSFFYTNGQNWENSRSFRYLRLFRLLAPELSIPKTTAEISLFLGNILNPDLEKTVRKDYPVPSNTIKKIMADLTALKLMKCSETAFLGTDGKRDCESWVITEFGKETYAAYKFRQMNSKLRQKNSSTKS